MNDWHVRLPCAHDGCPNLASHGTNYCQAHLCRNYWCSEPHEEGSTECAKCNAAQRARGGGHCRSYDPSEANKAHLDSQNRDRWER